MLDGNIENQDSYEFETTEQQGRIISVNFIINDQILIGTDKGYLIKMNIKSDHTIVREYIKGKPVYKDCNKVMDNMMKVFFNQDRTMLVATAEKDDTFVLVNVRNLEVIHTQTLNRGNYTINCVCFNPFFKLSDVEMKE